MTTFIAVLFLVGPVVVVPLMLGAMAALPTPSAERLRSWARSAAMPAGVSLAAAFVAPTGVLAGVLAVPWLAIGGLALLAAMLDVVRALRVRDRHLVVEHVAIWAALSALSVAGINAAADRVGLQLLGFDPTIVLLTAVHFTFAGFALVLHGAWLLGQRPSPWLATAVGAVIVGIPITAAGFLGIAAAAWMGALIVAVGGLGIGVATLDASRMAHGPSRWLLAAAGTSLLITMPLAAAYATGVATGAGWLTIPAMAATHGTLNVLGFALPAAVAWRLARPATTRLG